MYRNFHAIIKAALLAGTLDLLAAFVYYLIKNAGKDPLVILKFISSAVFGTKAFTGGWQMIFSGLVFHYLIAFLFTLFFFFLYKRIAFLSRYFLVTGMLYGAFIWVVMNLIVLPLTKIPSMPVDYQNAFINILILIACIGIPISVLANNYYGSKTEI